MLCSFTPRHLLNIAMNTRFYKIVPMTEILHRPKRSFLNVRKGARGLLLGCVLETVCVGGARFPPSTVAVPPGAVRASLESISWSVQCHGNTMQNPTGIMSISSVAARASSGSLPRSFQCRSRPNQHHEHQLHRASGAARGSFPSSLQ